MEKLRALNFYTNHVKPAKDLLASRAFSTRQEKEYAAISLFETFWWLHLGRDIGYFSEEVHNAVLADIAGLLADRYSELARSEGGLANRGLFAEDLRLLIERFDFIADPLLSNATRAQPYFQTLLLLEEAFIKDPMARQFSLAISLDKQWDDWIGKELAVDPVMIGNLIAGLAQDAGSEELSSDHLLGGFFRVLEHVVGCDRVIDNLQADPHISRAGKVRFEFRARRILAWRFDLTRSEVRSRFKDATNLAAVFISRDLSDSDKAAGAFNSFVRLVTQLTSRWSPPLTAAATT